MTLDAKAIEERIKEVLLSESGLSRKIADDVAFHMTDWLGDLARFSDFCADPEKFKNEEIERVLIAFLNHVPSHVAAASKLLTGLPVTDVFDVGAVDDGPDA